MNKFFHKLFIVKREAVIVLLIFIFAFCLRLFILAQSDNSHGIAIGKTMMAMNFLKNPGILKNYDASHPPVPHYIFAAALFLWKNPFITTRVVTLIFGSLLMFPFYYYTKLAFDRRIALYSTLIACVYAQHVIYSVLSTGETMFHFFLFCSFYLFMKFKKEAPKCLYLILSGFLLGCATLCRFEGGLFIPLLTLFLFKEKKRYISLFFFTAMILPGWWMFISYRVMHDPLSFLHVSDAVVPTTFNMERICGGLRLNLFDRISGWPKMLWDTLTPSVAVLGFLGLGYSLLRKKHLYFTFLFLTLFFAFVYKSAQEELLFDYRYGITLGLLFIPFAIFMIYKLLHVTGQRWRRVILALFIAYFAYRMVPAAIQQRPVTPSFVKDIGCYLSTHLNPQDKILVDSPHDDDHMYGVMVYSKVFDSKRMLSIPRKSVAQVFHVDEDLVKYILNEARPRFIIYSPEGYLPGVLHFSSVGRREEEYGVIFNFVYESGPYRIYEAVYRKGS